MRCGLEMPCDCGGKIKPLEINPHEEIPLSACDSKPFVCSACGAEYDAIPLCDGEVKNAWNDGKIVDCVCDKCGASHGKGALAREVFRVKNLV